MTLTTNWHEPCLHPSMKSDVAKVLIRRRFAKTCQANGGIRYGSHYVTTLFHCSELRIVKSLRAISNCLRETISQKSAADLCKRLLARI